MANGSQKAMVTGGSKPHESWKRWVLNPKIGVGPQNGLFIMENPIKMDDLGIFGGTPIFGNTQMWEIILCNEFLEPS